MDDEQRRGILGEVLMDELRIIQEYVQDIPDMKHQLESVDGRLANVESDMKVVKKIAGLHSQEIRDLQTKVS